MKPAAKVLLALAAVALCAGLSDAVFYLRTGSLPPRGNSIPAASSDGATTDDIRERFGPPHGVYERDGRVHRVYWHDAFGVAYAGVQFDASSRGAGTWS